MMRMHQSTHDDGPGIGTDVRRNWSYLKDGKTRREDIQFWYENVGMPD